MPTHSERRQVEQDANRERERPPLSGGSLATPRGRGACPRAEGERTERSRNRPTDGVGDSSGGWEDGQQVLSPSLLHQRPSSIVWRCDVSQNSCPDYGSRESGRAEGEREWAARMGRNICFTYYSPLSSIFCLSSLCLYGSLP